MKASEKKIISLFEQPNAFFNIPVYQRDYNWQEKHCQLLFDDILKLGENDNVISHFIGSIVYIQDDVYTTGDTDLNIIDGQQRMTTLTLLFMALYKKLKENSSRIADKICDQYLVNRYSEREINLKLVSPEENLIILDKIFKGEFKELEEDQDKNLVKNYKFFENKLQDFSKEELKKVIAGIEKLICVEISLERGKDDPQKIFESLNSTGLDLSQADLIRNYILMDLERDKQNKIYKKIWLPIEKNCKVSDGTKIINYVSDFMRDYLTLKNGKIPTKPKVFEEFKKYYNGDLDEILKEIKEYSYMYACILKPELEKESKLRKELEYLKLLDQTVMNPFLIGILKDYKEEKIPQEELLSILHLLQSFIWRRYITGEGTNALNTLFQGMHLKVMKSEEHYKTLEKILMNQVFPTDEELKRSLKLKPLYKDKNRLNYVFRRMENYYHNELIDFDNEKITIEHIFPQKPNKEWKEKYSVEELEQMMSVKDTISNLTLTGSNSNLSNRSFEFKRDEEVYGYKNSKLYLNKYLGEIESWDLLHMEKRFEKLYKDIVKIWTRPKEEFEDLDKITFVITGPLTSGTGKLLSNNKFEILKGSSFTKKVYNNAKEQNDKILLELKEKGMIEELEDKYILKENFKVTSPSAAAKLILGRTANGWAEWKTYEGKLLDAYRDKD